MADGSVILTRPSGYAMEVSGLVSPSRRREGEPELLRLSLNPGLLVRLRRPSVARAARSLEEAGRRVTKLFGPAARCFITPSPHRTEKPQIAQMVADNPSHYCCSPKITQMDTDSIARRKHEGAKTRRGHEDIAVESGRGVAYRLSNFVGGGQGHRKGSDGQAGSPPPQSIAGQSFGLRRRQVMARTSSKRQMDFWAAAAVTAPVPMRSRRCVSTSLAEP